MTDDSIVPPLDLDGLLDLLSRATPGPWIAHREGDTWHLRTGNDTGVGHIEPSRPGFNHPRDCADATLIAEAINALPALVAAARERDALWRERDEARAVAGVLGTRSFPVPGTPAGDAWAEKWKAAQEQAARWRDELDAGIYWGLSGHSGSGGAGGGP